MAAALAIAAGPARAAANLNTDDFQFLDEVVNNGLVSLDVSTTMHTGDTASITLVEWTNPGLVAIGGKPPPKTTEINMTFDCVQKTYQVVRIIARDAAGQVMNDNDAVTPPRPLTSEQSLTAVSLRLACSKGNKIGNMPVYTGRAAALDHTAKFFAGMNPPVFTPPKPSP